MTKFFLNLIQNIRIIIIIVYTFAYASHCERETDRRTRKWEENEGNCCLLQQRVLNSLNAHYRASVAPINSPFEFVMHLRYGSFRGIGINSRDFAAFLFISFISVDVFRSEYCLSTLRVVKTFQLFSFNLLLFFSPLHLKRSINRRRFFLFIPQVFAVFLTRHYRNLNKFDPFDLPARAIFPYRNYQY